MNIFDFCDLIGLNSQYRSALGMKYRNEILQKKEWIGIFEMEKLAHLLPLHIFESEAEITPIVEVLPTEKPKK